MRSERRRLAVARRPQYAVGMDSIVHVCNGDSTADSLSLADLPGEIRVWADALNQGPVLPVADDAYWQARAAFLQTRGLADAGKKIAGYDHAVDEAARAEELILWFEHDLFDQLALIRLLARLARRGLPQQLTIVSIDRHPEVPGFLGLGQLKPEQLAELWPRRTTLSRDAIDPRYPITDSDLFWTLHTLGRCGFVTGAPEGVVTPAALKAIQVAITPHGREALAGAVDRVHVHGIDDWRGGVHLAGKGPVWRWDGAQRKLIEK